MELKTWGQVWHEDIPRSRDNRCPLCGNGTLGTPSILNVRKYIVGIDESGGSAYKTRAIFKCQSCNGLFWFHLDIMFAILVLEGMEDR